MFLAIFGVTVTSGTLRWYSVNYLAAMVALVVLSAHTFRMLLGVLRVLGYYNPSGFYWSDFLVHSNSGMSHGTLVMDTGMTVYCLVSWPHKPAEDFLSGWLSINTSQFLDPSHEIICDGLSRTWTLTPPCSLGMGCTAADTPDKCPPILCSSNWNPPLKSPCKYPLAGSSWYWFFQHCNKSNLYEESDENIDSPLNPFCVPLCDNATIFKKHAHSPS